MVVRVYSREEILKIGQFLLLDEKQFHYLVNVMRLECGDCFLMFDGKNGEFKVRLENVNKRNAQVQVIEKERDFALSPDVWLLFAPLKKDKTDMVIQKTTELGCRKIMPVHTTYTNAEKIRNERYFSQAIEAAEQCRRVDVPEIAEIEKLENVLAAWDDSRPLFFLNEKGQGNNIASVLEENKGPAAIIVGPEGGFSEQEVRYLKSFPFVKDISLGKRILRAETAVIAALSCWQALNGDW